MYHYNYKALHNISLKTFAEILLRCHISVHNGRDLVWQQNSPLGLLTFPSVQRDPDSRKLFPQYSDTVKKENTLLS